MKITVFNIFNGKKVVLESNLSLLEYLKTNKKVNLSGANLSGANLSEANLSEANLSVANLSEANLSEAYLSGANLHGANLYVAYLSEAYLSGANLSEANLSEAYLSGANLSGTNLYRANLYGVSLSQLLRNNSVQSLLTIIHWNNLSDSLVLEMMRHDAESCGVDKMSKWASGGFLCPFIRRIRDYHFKENPRLWVSGIPLYRGIELLKILCKTENIVVEEGI